MSSEATVIAGLPASWHWERLQSFRLIPRIEKHPQVVALAQTAAGKLALLTCFGLVLYRINTWSLLTVAALGLVAFLPRYRHTALMAGTVGYTAIVTLFGPYPYRILACHGIVLVLGACLIWVAASQQRSEIGKHAIVVLFGLFNALILFCCWLPSTNGHSETAWFFTIILGSYVWFIGYALLEQEPRSMGELRLEVASLRPFWGSTATPFPSGPACLRQVEAKDSEKLAMVQLKGLKLLLWAELLSLFLGAYNWFCHDYLRIPPFQRALYLSALHTPLPWYVCWTALILYYFEKLIVISVWSHRIVACCRMAGFDALRNTYRPLSSTTVAEFFNRYYFYYKELLVYFFFFPTFLRLPARLGKWRVTIGIFAAACLGNAYYHFTRDLWYIQAHGLWQSIKTFQVFFFYTVVLATAISLSRRRGRPDPSQGFFRSTLRPAIFTSLFYCLLGIFSTTDRNYPLVEHLRFLGHLFLLS
ncbi:MAG TPA: hypothetical protein VEJ47_07750 [Candidatus Eremiobacteraceae bacterium]|nr:hypothetical protein [Candidatus Eremiobacteraceae bacterium]